MQDNIQQIASAFVKARMRGDAISTYPGVRPLNLATAYQIQDKALAIWDRPLGGWKVGRINPPQDSVLGANRLVGPAFRDSIFESGVAEAAFQAFRGGFNAAEAEFMLRLAPRDAAPPTTLEEAMSWIDEVRIGIEIASSPYAAINADGPCVTVSDHGNNSGLILGPVVPREVWNRLDDVEVTVEVDGAEVGRATTATMLDGPFGAAKFLIDHLFQRGIVIEKGWWISSGAITGVHEVSPGESITARFSGLGAISTALV